MDIYRDISAQVKCDLPIIAGAFAIASFLSYVPATADLYDGI